MPNFFCSLVPPPRGILPPLSMACPPISWIGIDHDYRRTLVARHDRGRQPRGSCAGDDHISDPVKTNLAAPALCGGLSG